MSVRSKRFNELREQGYNNHEIKKQMEAEELARMIDALPDHTDAWCDLKAILRKLGSLS